MSRPKPQGKTRLQLPGGHISRLGYLLDLDKEQELNAHATQPTPCGATWIFLHALDDEPNRHPPASAHRARNAVITLPDVATGDR